LNYYEEIMCDHDQRRSDGVAETAHQE
jgi:hypothetical protein